MIAPDPQLLIKKPSDTVIRLSYNRIENHTVWLIDNRNSKENCVIKSDFNSIWQGFIESRIASKVANNIGLIWQIFIDDKALLFTGDCEYKYMPNALKNCSYDVLMVPHHGSEKTRV